MHPTAKRVLVVPRGGPSAPRLQVPAALLQDRSEAEPVLRAMTLGAVDTYLPSPQDARDEGFHQAVSELLEEWAYGWGQDRPAVRVIAHEGSAWAHKLRDVLARNGVPYEFRLAGSSAGRALTPPPSSTRSRDVAESVRSAIRSPPSCQGGDPGPGPVGQHHQAAVRPSEGERPGRHRQV
jgi:thioredoxin reductase (NADPH)